MAEALKSMQLLIRVVREEKRVINGGYFIIAG